MILWSFAPFLEFKVSDASDFFGQWQTQAVPACAEESMA